MSISLDDYLAKLPPERVKAARLAAEARKKELIASGVIKQQSKTAVQRQAYYSKSPLENE